MKNILTVLIILISIRAQAQWTNIGPGGEALSGVSFRSATDGWVCGSNGTLLSTADGGTTWQPATNSFQTTGPHSQVLAVYTVLTGFVRNVAVLTQQTDLLQPTQVYYYAGFGLGFRPGFTGDASGDFVCMSFHTYKLGLLVGAGGALRTSDNTGGASWNQVPSGTQNDLWGADSPDGNTYFLVGSKGTLRKATRYGGTSKALNSGTFARLTGVWFVDVNQGYVIGDGGTALRTTDGGSTWQPMAVNATVNLNAVRFLDATTGFIVGDLGTLLLTTDGGQTWQPEASHTYETLNAICATADGEHIWIVGGNGTVLKRGAVVPLPLASRGAAPAPQWEAYPNPFTTVLTLTGPAVAGSLPAEVSLFDQLGRLVFSQTVGGGPTAAFERSLAVPPTLAPGVYTLRVALPGQLPTTRRLVRLP